MVESPDTEDRTEETISGRLSSAVAVVEVVVAGVVGVAGFLGSFFIAAAGGVGIDMIVREGTRSEK